jgi:N-acetylmuramoyl-L-alanine amidase
MSGKHFSRRKILLAGTAGAASVATLSFLGTEAFADGERAPKLYIDPGHGGSDSGAVGNGLQEKNLTLDISLKVRDLMAPTGVAIRMSRDSDITRSLDYRSSDANSWGATFFISIHINSGGGTGFESFRYTSASQGSIDAHGKLHPAVLSAMQGAGSVTDRGPKTANFHVLRETSMPALLSENLFIDTPADANLLGSESFRAAAAQGHANALKKILGV